MTRIKICGINDAASFAAAVTAGADYVGFVFFSRSPRHLEGDVAAELAANGPSGVKRIGLFVDPDNDYLAGAVRAGRLDGIQLHGGEPPERVAAVKAATGLEVWKAVSVATRDDIMAARRYAGVADRILFDARTPEGAELPGGMGVRFDWRLLAGIVVGAPWGLAGGLDASTVADAIATTHAPLVDVSSGVEVAPGVKLPAKIREFCEAVRSR